MHALCCLAEVAQFNLEFTPYTVVWYNCLMHAQNSYNVYIILLLDRLDLVLTIGTCYN